MNDPLGTPIVGALLGGPLDGGFIQASVVPTEVQVNGENGTVHVYTIAVPPEVRLVYAHSVKAKPRKARKLRGGVE